MTDTDLDKRLRGYLDRQDEERDAGHTLESLHRAVSTVATGLSDHMIECEKYRREARAASDSTHLRLVNLEARKVTSSTPPAARDRETSSHDLEQFAEEIKKAAIEGFKRPDTTPEAKVQEVVAEELARKDQQREFEQLKADAKARQEAAAESKKTRSKILLAVTLTALSSPLLVHLVELAFKGHP